MKNTNNNSSQKSKNGQTPNLGYNLRAILLKKGKEVGRYCPTSKSRLYSFLRAGENKKWASVDLTVTYKPGVWNSGEFTTYTDARRFIQECTEPELLNHVKGGIWKSST